MTYSWAKTVSYPMYFPTRPQQVIPQTLTPDIFFTLLQIDGIMLNYNPDI